MERAGMQEYFSEVRAYFAPVNRVTETGTVFDPSLSFDLKNPPPPWVHLGLVRNFKRVGKTAMGTMRCGAAGVMKSQFLKAVDARVSLDFCDWGKLQMGLAASSQHMNVLESAGSQPRASGGAAKAGQPVLAGSTASLILIDPSALDNYQVGELIVVDVDYTAGMGDLGTGITGGVAFAGTALDLDGIRRASYNVGCVASITPTGLQLDAPLLGGAPASGARVQKVVAFVDRDGDSFLQEWSALFALEEASGGRVYFYYPRLQAASAAAETVAALANGISNTLLHAEFEALASVDANDGQNVVCYRCYVPAAGAPAY